MLHYIRLIPLMAMLLLVGCAGLQTHLYENADALSRFDSERDAMNYANTRATTLNKLRRLRPRMPSTSLGVEEVVVSGVRASTQESITNNQETDVDEGGIAKRHGEYLLILRRGVIYSIRVGSALEKIDEISVQPDAWDHDAWYDEMLVHEDRIVVTGYSYDTGLSEYIFIDIQENGTLRWDEAYLIDAGDYYSDGNYASRLIDGNLVFYMANVDLSFTEPNDFAQSDHSADSDEFYDIFRSNERGSPLSPKAIKIGRDGTPEGMHTLFHHSDVYSPILAEGELLATVIAICPIQKSAPLSCRAVSLLGGSITEHYVSADAYYLWMTGDEWNVEYEKMPERALKKLARSRSGVDASETVSALYRVPFNGDPIGAIKVPGQPLDQFSFKQHQDHLFVVTRIPQENTRWFSPDYHEGSTYLLEIPITCIDSQVSNIPGHQQHLIDSGKDGDRANRFIGDQLLYTKFVEFSESTRLYLIDINLPDRSYQLNTNIYVQQIHPIETNAVLVGLTEDESVAYATLNLSATPFIVDLLSESSGNLAESRSHAFFYRPNSQGGIFGVPIAHTIERSKWENGAWQYIEDLVDMQFTRIAPDLRMNALGSLKATREDQWFSSNDCHISCYDWYGSARPIFWDNRILALLKYEVVEGIESDVFLEEIQRIDIKH